jgi:periplasmic divalent cation tolerance protein
MDGTHALVFVTAPSEAEAIELGQRLVDERLAACVNVAPGITSIFLWQGAREQVAEARLVIKTRRERYPALPRRILELHPYSIPEVLALAVDAGAPACLEWVRDSVPVEGR